MIIKPLTKAKLMQVLEKYVSAEDIRATDRNKATRTGRRTMVLCPCHLILACLEINPNLCAVGRRGVACDMQQVIGL